MSNVLSFSYTITMNNFWATCSFIFFLSEVYSLGHSISTFLYDVLILFNISSTLTPLLIMDL